MTRAQQLIRDSLVWDNHACLPYGDTARWVGEIDLWRRSGVDVVLVNIGDGQENLETLARMAAHIRSFVAENSDRFVMATSVAAIEKARVAGKTAVGLNVEGAFALGDQLSMLQLCYDLGVRWMLMVYNRANLVGSGVHDEEDNGLTPFGRQVVAEMDRIGMVKCCTHTGYRTARDVFAATDKPTIFSHSNPRALKDHPRNIPDDLIDACAATGGVVCINGVGIFLGDNDNSPRTFVNHLDYVADRVGADHVGVGLDFVINQSDMDAALAANADVWPPEWGYKPGIKFMSPAQLGEVTEEMLARKWKEDDVKAVLGGNLMRVAKEVWR
jgi:membrane dipeptidase